MGKRKKATKKAIGPRRKEPLGMFNLSELAVSLKLRQIRRSHVYSVTTTIPSLFV